MHYQVKLILRNRASEVKFRIWEQNQPAKSFFNSSRPERDCRTGATTYVGSEIKRHNFTIVMKR